MPLKFSNSDKKVVRARPRPPVPPYPGPCEKKERHFERMTRGRI